MQTLSMHMCSVQLQVTSLDGFPSSNTLENVGSSILFYFFFFYLSQHSFFGLTCWVQALTSSTQVRPLIFFDSIIISSHGLILILDTGMFAYNIQSKKKKDFRKNFR